jgi:hypothetical protein
VLVVVRGLRVVRVLVVVGPVLVSGRVLVGARLRPWLQGVAVDVLVGVRVPMGVLVGVHQVPVAVLVGVAVLVLVGVGVGVLVVLAVLPGHGGLQTVALAGV